MNIYFKLMLCVIFLFLITTSLLACADYHNEEGDIMYISSNVEESNQALYNLSELKEYFSKHHLNERFLDDDFEPLYFEEVNSVFPIQNTVGNTYSYYNVKEGGRFFVFWVEGTPFEANSAFIEESVNNPKAVYFTAYLSNKSIKSEKDFKQIKCNVSTADDIKNIDSNAEFCYLFSSGVRSFSLLSDGRILEVEYQHSQNEVFSNLIVKNINIVDKNKTPSCFAKLSDTDLQS